MRRVAVIVLLLVMALAGPVRAAELRIVGGLLPPMLDEAGRGREADIIGETLARCGHTAAFTVQPFTRHWQSFAAGGEFDAVATVPEGLALPGHRSAVYIRYQNGVSYLAARGLAVADLAGLAGKQVIAFAGARGILPGLEAAIPGFASYTEQADQINQSRLMFAGRIDAVLGDGLIFAEYNAKLRRQGQAQPLGFDPGQAVVFRAIFPDTPYTLAFRDEAMRDAFDRCFAELAAAGRIDAINRSYVERHRDVLGDQYLGY